MFFKSLTNPPIVKKASELIDTKSHKQKKHISLMLVPSYSTGRTRSLRIPRWILQGSFAIFLVISAVVTGFYLRSSYFMRLAQDQYVARLEVEENLAEFQYEAEIVQSDLIDTIIQVYERYNDAQQNVETRLESQAREHQEDFDGLRLQVEQFEELIRALEAEQRAIMDGLHERANIIPPVADILQQLEESRTSQQTAISQQNERPQSSVQMMGLSTAQPRINEFDLEARLFSLINEVNIQRNFLEDLEAHQARMMDYLLNYPTLWPLRGNISSGFGWRTNPMGGSGNEHHDGVDIPARTGTPIRAAGGGVVSYSGWQSGYGRIVIINHGGGKSTFYAHNSRNAVEVGQRVERGDIIAYVGSTGRSTGPHLHFEVRVNGRPVNPVPFMREFYS